MGRNGKKGSSVATVKPNGYIRDYLEKDYNTLNRGCNVVVERFIQMREVALIRLSSIFMRKEIEQIRDSFESYCVKTSAMVDVMSEVVGGSTGEKIGKLSSVECSFLFEYCYQLRENGNKVDAMFIK